MRHLNEAKYTSIHTRSGLTHEYILTTSMQYNLHFTDAGHDHKAF